MTERFANQSEARKCVERQPFFCGVMFDVHAEKCVGMDCFSVVVCVANNRRGKKTCKNAAEVDDFVKEFRVR